jgi:hypothetical protein
MANKKTIQIFMRWLASSGLFYKYWILVKLVCEENNILLSDYILNLDATNPESLFRIIEHQSDLFRDAKEKYTNWLKI